MPALRTSDTNGWYALTRTFAEIRSPEIAVIFKSALVSREACISLENSYILFNSKNIYFVPFGQDNYEKKPNSIIAKSVSVCLSLVKKWMLTGSETIECLTYGAKQ